MTTSKKSSHKRKIPANLEKNVRVYFKVKNKLGMFECWCEIRPKLEERKSIFTLPRQTEKIFPFCFRYFKFRMWNASKQQFDSKYFDWLSCRTLW